MLQSDGTYLRSRTVLMLECRHKPRLGSRYFVYRHYARDLVLIPHLPRQLVLLDSLPLYSNCLCVICVFSYADIHTIAMRLVSCFSPSNPLPSFRILDVSPGGCLTMLRVLLYGCFFHSPITVWRTNLVCQVLCLWGLFRLFTAYKLFI